ncbi:MAG: metal-dependent hydrolase [Nanoarchaeota archaeon]|nr:metal-dependent hydrolase [Nanoarchaeota archaeon]
MLFRTHILFSLAVYFFLRDFLPMSIWVLFFVLLAAAFVDVDIGKSKIGNHWFFRPLQWLTKHRGFLHSLGASILFSLIVASFSRWAGIGFFIGYISHLFLDCLTKAGVYLFWPFKWKVRGFIRSGGIFEDVIFSLLFLWDGFIVARNIGF